MRLDRSQGQIGRTGKMSGRREVNREKEERSVKTELTLSVTYAGDKTA